MPWSHFTPRSWEEEEWIKVHRVTATPGASTLLSPCRCHQMDPPGRSPSVPISWSLMRSTMTSWWRRRRFSHSTTEPQEEWRAGGTNSRRCWQSWGRDPRSFSMFAWGCTRQTSVFFSRVISLFFWTVDFSLTSVCVTCGNYALPCILLFSMVAFI